jgi:antitoxin YefM
VSRNTRTGFGGSFTGSQWIATGYALAMTRKLCPLDFMRVIAYAFEMTSITATQARQKLYSLIDEANDSHEPIQITGKRANAVLLSEDDWRAIQETLHLQSVPGLVDSIREASKEGIEGASDKLDW